MSDPELRERIKYTIAAGFFFLDRAPDTMTAGEFRERCEWVADEILRLLEENERNRTVLPFTTEEDG